LAGHGENKKKVSEVPTTISLDACIGSAQQIERGTGLGRSFRN